MDRLRYSENKQYLTLDNVIYEVNDLGDIDRVCDILFSRDVFCPLTQVMIRGVYYGKHGRRENWLVMDLFLKVFTAPGLGFVVTHLWQRILMFSPS